MLQKEPALGYHSSLCQLTGANITRNVSAL